MSNKKSPKTSSNNGSDAKDVGFGVNIKNWNDWFQNCGKLTVDLKAYEGFVNQYHKEQHPKTQSGGQDAYDAFVDQHRTRFYDYESKLPGWMLSKAVLHMVLGALAGLVIMMLVFGIAEGSFKPVVPLLLKSGGIGLLIGALIGWTMPVLHIFKINSLIKKMSVIENKIKDRISYVPPKYRNSQATDTLYSLFCNYGVVTFNQAIAACDDYLLSNGMPGATMAFLFDEPYSAKTMSNQAKPADTDRGLYAGGSDTSDPNLPDDIATKTYKGAEDADKKLDALIGLESVKDQVRQMKNRMDFYDGAKSDRISGSHMVFLGPPGTGKTTIARIITKILYDFGYIQENKCVEIDGGYLKSPYQGQTTERANAIIRYSMGGVLFIDEAYLLYDEKGGPGTEAAGVLLKAMEDHKTDFVVIMAGYEDNVNRLLSSNEGFASRIKYKIYFDNFSVDELMDIFKMQLKQYSSDPEYEIEEKALDLLRNHFEKERRIPGFGNARVVRNSLDCIMDNHADHFIKGDIESNKKHVVTELDVSAFIEVRAKQMQEDGRNFIASKNLDSSVISLQELKGKTKSGSEDPDKDLEALTGLDVVKKEIIAMKNQFSFYDGKVETEGNHMVFLGPPGTGKTTVASIMTGYLYKMGLINDNSYLDVNGDFLRGMYLGHTGKRTEAVVQYAQGMVLFIDEAYLLSASDASSDQFGQEAVGVLLDAMEKYRKNFVVIFAGYEHEMNQFLDMNSGLRSRISLEFHFKSYSPHELAKMLQNVGKNNGFKFEKDLWVPVQQYFKTQVQNPKFGNGRFVRQFFENCKKAHITNYANGLYDESKKYMITLTDVQGLLRDDQADYL